ncbi:unnamed protein product [Chrysodeixis includens]|uniref:Uncharacterized protein n=1 Tax=Chrysodeixis includens TaxID=689277 RepID=A0A9P0FW67_CHRIL|nr:unnamed protein product [Chrysodeixis includens]
MAKQCNKDGHNFPAASVVTQSWKAETRVYSVVLSKFFPLTIPASTPRSLISFGSSVPWHASGPPESPIATSVSADSVQTKVFISISQSRVHRDRGIVEMWAFINIGGIVSFSL